MLLFLLAFAAEPLTTYADLPLLGLLGKHSAFFAPLIKQLESARKATLPAVCPADTKAAVQLDVASYLTHIAKTDGLGSREVKRLTALGLSEAKTLTACFAKKRLTVVLDGPRVAGLLGTLTPAALDLSGLAGDHYWLARSNVAWVKTYQALQDLDRAQTGMRASRLDALVIAASMMMEGDAEVSLITPVTGRMAMGELADGKHFAELDVTDSSGYARLLRSLDGRAPHADFGRKKKANEWGFFGGLSGFSGQGSVFVQLEPHQVRVADAATALDRPRTFKGVSVQAAVLGTLDVPRYRKLFERVGRAEDVRTFVRTHKLQSLVELKAAPAPAALMVGDRVIYSVQRENGRITLDATN